MEPETSLHLQIMRALMTATERAQDYAPMGEVAEHLYDALSAFYRAGGKPTIRPDKGE